MNIVISGPSGVGKGTLISRLLKENYNIEKSVSFTTRKPRKGEINGIDYYFVSFDEFDLLKNNNYFFECAEYDNNYYGISNNNVFQNDKIEIFDLIVSSGLNIKEAYPNTILIYILPPSFEVLNERRGNRGDNRVEYDIEQLNLAKYYDFFIVNENIEEAYKNIIDIINTYYKNSIKNNLNVLSSFSNDMKIKKRILLKENNRC